MRGRSCWRHRSRTLWRAARQQSPISVMFQLGETEGLLMGVHLKSVIPEVPEFDDGERLLQWSFRGSRAQGTVENAVFTDSAGKEGGDRSCLLSSISTSPGVLRNNLTSLRPDVAHTVQIKSLRLHTAGDSNCKIMMGYMGTDWRFAHGANADLAHWAGGDRVVLFVPIRHARNADPVPRQLCSEPRHRLCRY